MRIVLINVPIREGEAPNAFPTGLGIIAQVLLNAGHDVRVIDANAERYKIEETVDKALALDGDVIAMSGLISTFRYQAYLSIALKEQNPEAKIVSGGGCATAVPELLLRHTAVDIAVLGEGERTVVDLLDAFEGGRPLESVDGIAYRHQGRETYKTSPRAPEIDLDELSPIPAYELFPMEIYIRNPIWGIDKRSINLVSSRGCPMDCSFCYNLFGQRSYRRRGVERIIEEVRFLRDQYNIEFFAFVDDNLTIHKQHCLELCEALGKENIEWGCHGRVDSADDERLSAMAAAGCRWLGFGIESANAAILRRMNKRTTIETARAAIERTRAHGIFANTTFIMGYPGETEATIRETMRFKIDMNLMASDFFATPYPGTELYREAKAKGIIEDDLRLVLALNNAYDLVVNFTDFSNQHLVELENQVCLEVELAIRFKEMEPTLEEGVRYLGKAFELLNWDFFLPDVKGHVLHWLARYYNGRGLFEDSDIMRERGDEILAASQRLYDVPDERPVDDAIAQV